MRITDHPKLQQFPAKERYVHAARVTGSFKSSDWTAKDQRILEQLSSKYEQFSAHIFSKHFLADLYSHHQDTWKKFYFFSRNLKLRDSFRLQLEHALLDNKCELCQQVWVTANDNGFCSMCLAKDPNIAKLRHQRASARTNAELGTARYAVKRKGHPEVYLPKGLEPEKLLIELVKLTGKFSIKDWTKKDDRVLKQVMAKHDNGKGVKWWLDRAFAELKEMFPEIWNKFWYLARPSLLDSRGRINYVVDSVLERKVCAMCKSTFTPSLVCTVCDLKHPEEAHTLRYEIRNSKVRELNQTQHEVDWNSQRLEVRTKNKQSHANRTPKQKKQTRDQTKKTNLEIYGAPNPLQNPKVAAQVSETWKAKSDDEIKQISNSRSRTYERKTGFTNPRKNPVVVEKADKTYFERTGYTHTTNNPESEAQRHATNIERYGSMHPMQNAEVHAKANSKSSLKRKVNIDGVIHTVQGGAEERLIHLLVAKHGNGRAVITQFNKKLYPKDLANDYCGYRPDFYIPSLDVFAECKSTYYLYNISDREYERNKGKAKLAGTKLKWIIEGRPNFFVQLPLKWYTWTKEKLVKYIKENSEKRA